MLDYNNPKFFNETAGGHYDIRFFRGTLDPEERTDVLRTLFVEFVRMCSRFKKTPILMHGALIGWFWNKKLLPWDSDIDVCLAYEDLAFLHERQMEVGEFYDRSRYLFEINPHFENRQTLNSHINRNLDPNKIDARFVDTLSGLFVDVTALSPIEDDWIGTKCPHHYRLEDLFPLQISEFEGAPIGIPANVEAVLIQEYGEEVVTRTQFNGYRFDAESGEWLPAIEARGGKEIHDADVPYDFQRSRHAGMYLYRRIGFDFRTMELRKDGSIGKGAASCERSWKVSTDGSNLEILAEDGSTTCILSRSEDDDWKGRWLIGEQMEIELQPWRNDEELRSLKTENSTAAPEGAVYVREYHARFINDSLSLFRDIRNSSILIVWPHGLGDWVFLGYVLPFLDRSNRYFVTRLGDDIVSVFESCADAVTLYCGIPATPREAKNAFPHIFGHNIRSASGETKSFTFPASLADQCEKHKIDFVYASEFPETTGTVPFPFHSKARGAVRRMTSEIDLPEARMRRPLANSIRLTSPAWVVKWVESRLSTLGGRKGRKLCLICHTGFSTPEKNWGGDKAQARMDPRGRLGDPYQARSFIRLMKTSDPRWMFISFEDRILPEEYSLRNRADSAFSYTEIFGRGIPFGLVLSHLISISDLCIGVPTGPFHLSMIRQDLPSIGINEIQFPSWYDEPKPSAIHVLNRKLIGAAAAKRPGSFAKCEELEFRHLVTESDHIRGEDAFHAAELLGV